jgi:uncharacterized cofD-like protein
MNKTAKKKKVVVIGGGTGTYTVLSGLRSYKNLLDISVVVSMMDSGGSNRVIRDEFGLLPTSDIRQCIVALSSEKPSDIVRKLFTYRYNQGTGISGMTFGNLFMAALTDIYGSQEIAIEKTCEFLDVQGEIIPVTFDKTHLVARYDNGKQILGEHYIDEPDEGISKHKIVELSVFPPARLNPKAAYAVMKADMIVLGPGDLYTSIICNLVVDNLWRIVRESRAKVVYVLNLMTRWGQTNGFTALDHINELEKYLGRGRIDYVLINKDKSFSEDVLERYRQENAFPVEDDTFGVKDLSFQVVRGRFLAKSVFEKDKADNLHRSLIRHDPHKLAKAIVSIFFR